MYDTKIQSIDINSSIYPVKLKNILQKHAPKCLYCLGNLDLFNSVGIGFCGSRHASNKGISVAKDCVEQLVEKNYSIVSGNASGIDFTTHFTALKNSGNTILVLPEGINNFKIKKDLETIWNWERTLVISEFHPDAIWRSYQAMQRNSTIIALSQAMIVIEARENGGTLEAGKTALRLGCTTYVVEYSDIDNLAPGNKILLNKGAIALKKSSYTQRANISRIFDDYVKKNEQLGFNF